MWKYTFASACGTSHVRGGQPCQDFVLARIVEAASGPVLVAACADGAGSAELSDVGAKIAVDSFLESATGFMMQDGADVAHIDEPTLIGWAKEAHRQIEAEAEARQIIPRQFACTLLAAVVGSRAAAFAHIGDGVIVFDVAEGYEFAFWPDSGEYANMTRFLTDPDYDIHLRTECLPRALGEIALLTDGLQSLALNYAEGRVHAKFFRPMFQALCSAPHGDALHESLVSFLESKRVNDRTDDDKTLLLAARTKLTTDDVQDDTD